MIDHHLGLVLTRDNLQLSEVKTMHELLAGKAAPSCPNRLKRLLDAAYAPNTQRAYRSDIEQYRRWGGEIPASEMEVASYIADRAGVLSVSTLRRHIASLSQLHKALGVTPNPLQSPQITAMLRGLSRLHGRPQRGVQPLLIGDLREILDLIPETALGMRDACLLSLGFAGGFRRSELVSLNLENLQKSAAGLQVTLNRSKTDQAGAGRVIGIPRGRSKFCPVQCTERWVEAGDLSEGPLFRPVQKSGIVRASRLSSEAVASSVKKWVEKIGLDPSDYSGHSLRAGFVTSAVRAGASEYAIRKQTGHASLATMERYIRIANVFEDNACSVLF